MRIIGIDPGYDRCGVAVVERSNDGKEVLLYSKCIQTDKKDPFEDRLLFIAEQLKEVIKHYAPHVCAIEKLFFTKNRKTAMQVAEARGAIIVTMRAMGLYITEYTPNEIKVAITGDGGASKQQIILMLPHLVSVEKNIKKDDEYDAIAIALTASALTRGVGAH